MDKKYDGFVNTLRDKLKKINKDSRLTCGESMAEHTTFQTGGPADLYFAPPDKETLIRSWPPLLASGLPLFVLGGGANILVADKGIRGVVVDMKPLTHFRMEGDRFICETGMEISDAARESAARGYDGLAPFYSMPGTVGGALWMNARCYGRSISDTAVSALCLDKESGQVSQVPLAPEEFGYKQSPFQDGRRIMLEGEFRLSPGSPEELLEQMEGFKADRAQKGHFAAPSAGSVFKNDRRLGRPTGKIIDELGLRGAACGKARVSPAHANIIINEGGASAQDILDLIIRIEQEALDKKNIRLQREVLLVGEWER